MPRHKPGVVQPKAHLCPAQLRAIAGAQSTEAAVDATRYNRYMDVPRTAWRSVRHGMTFLRQVGELRDGLIVLGAGIYITGYAVWATYAHANGFGPLPALDAQYFVVGFPVFVMLAVAIAVCVLALYVLTRYWFLLRPLIPAHLQTRIMRIVVFGVPALAVIYLILRRYLTPLAASVADLVVIFVESVATVLLFTILLVDDDEFGGVGDAVFKPLVITEVIIMNTVCIVVFAAVTYVFDVYPLVPASLGGPSPRPALLDVTTGGMSAQMRTALIGATATTERVATTKKVYVYAETADYIWVAGEQRRTGQPFTMLQMKRADVVAIHWLR